MRAMDLERGYTDGTRHWTEAGGFDRGHPRDEGPLEATLLEEGKQSRYRSRDGFP